MTLLGAHPSLEYLGSGGVDLQFEQAAAVLQQPDFIHPATTFALQLHRQHLPRMLGGYTLQHLGQGPYLTRPQRRAGAVVVGVVAGQHRRHPQHAGQQGSGPEGNKRSIHGMWLMTEGLDCRAALMNLR